MKIDKNLKVLKNIDEVLAQVKKQELCVSLAVISPKIADRLLSFNTSNRKLSISNVDAVVNALNLNVWELNGDALKFSPNILIDGQHRLAGCVYANKSITTLIVTGLNQKTFSTIDNGKKRNGNDVLFVEGVPRSQNANRLLTYLVNPVGVATEQMASFSNMQIMDAYEAFDADYINEATKEGLILYNKSAKIMPPTLFIYFYYLLTFAEKNRGEAQIFLHKLATGEELPRGDPVAILRQLFIAKNADAEKSHRIKMGYFTELVIKAWELSVAGKKTTLKSRELKYEGLSENNINYPTISGLYDVFDVTSTNLNRKIKSFSVTLFGSNNNA